MKASEEPSAVAASVSRRARSSFRGFAMVD
jgi:hypothetical protein